jgi:DNA-binding transcriptional ArsR family regulator
MGLKRDMERFRRSESDAVYALLAETFKALGDETRVRILHILLEGELSVGDLTDFLETSQSAVSHQLRILRAMRLVRGRRSGRSVFYSLDDDHIERLLIDGLDHVKGECDG